MCMCACSCCLWLHVAMRSPQINDMFGRSLRHAHYNVFFCGATIEFIPKHAPARRTRNVYLVRGPRPSRISNRPPDPLLPPPRSFVEHFMCLSIHLVSEHNSHTICRRVHLYRERERERENMSKRNALSLCGASFISSIRLNDERKRDERERAEQREQEEDTGPRRDDHQHHHETQPSAILLRSVSLVLARRSFRGELRVFFPEKNHPSPPPTASPRSSVFARACRQHFSAQSPRLPSSFTKS